MSYHLPGQHAPLVPSQYAGPSYPLARATVPLMPLAEASASSDTIMGIPKDVLIAIVVVLIAIAVIWWINEQDKKPVTPNRSRVKKQSTAEMAKNLYARLEGRGGANETTLRSLQQLGRKR